MGQIIDIKIPDLGDFKDVRVIEILVSVGDDVSIDQPLLTLESDKATMEIPSPHSGQISALTVKMGDVINSGVVIGQMASSSAAKLTEAEKASAPATPVAASAASAPTAVAVSGGADMSCEVLVLGGGPGGYTAAFRAADLGKNVILVEKFPVIGGVCLNVGCIPSKALLHIAHIMNETKEMASHGVTFADPVVDLDKMRGFKEGVIKKLTTGLLGLAKQRKVQVVTGFGKFVDSHTLAVTDDEGAVKTIRFEQAIIAAGSRVIKLPFIPHDDSRVWDSTDALNLQNVPNRLLILGGGIIGLEMAQVYGALGSQITIVELMDQLIPGADPDMVRPLMKRIKPKYQAIHLKTKVTAVEAKPEALSVTFVGEGDKTWQEDFDAVLVAVGRAPNGAMIDADKAGVLVTDRGFIPADQRQKTNVDHIYAIGDVIGQPMLAHKAVHEGKVAAEVICGLPSAFTPVSIPSVAYTDPEVAWVGMTEREAKEKGFDIEVGMFPWAASGRSLSIGRDEGMTKAIFDAKTHRLLGAAMTGTNAGELVAEAALALEMGADIADIALTIHPHPTLSETFAFAAEMAEGTITDLIAPKHRKK
jgi:dihydrolipoamide dehydrogenase